MMIRTTITLPEDLYEKLRTLAFYQKRTISSIARDGIRVAIKVKPKTENLEPFAAVRKIVGKYRVKNYKEITRKEIYDDIIKHKMSFGH